MTQHEKTIDRMLGGYISTHRNYAGLTRGQVAHRAGIPIERYACLERGNVFKSARREELKGIAEALGLEYADLERRACGAL